MNSRFFYFGLIIFIILISFVVYITQVLRLPIDFSSFYASILSLKNQQSPYQTQVLSFLNITKSSTLNLNTPFFVIIVSPLALLSYIKAFYFWQVLSMLALVYSGFLTLKIYPKQPKSYLLALFFSYPVLMNFLLGQLCSFLFLFIILGLQFERRNKQKLAGLCWGLATAIKLFPGLLLIYALSKKKYKLSLFFFITVLISFFIPYCIYGHVIYKQYLSALNQVDLYSHNWNASVSGFVFRVLSEAQPTPENLLSIKIYDSWIFTIGSFIYCYLMFFNKRMQDESKFNLTIVSMVFLSPLGWIYYLPLLFAPFLSLLNQSKTFSWKQNIVLLFCFALILMPQNYSNFLEMKPFILKISLYSQYFYGLLLMIIFFISEPKQRGALNKDGPVYILTKTLSLFVLYGFTFYVFFVNLGKLIMNYPAS